MALSFLHTFAENLDVFLSKLKRWMDSLDFCNSHLHDCKICKFKRLRSEPRFFLGENQNKQKQTFLRTALSGTFSCNA